MAHFTVVLTLLLAITTGAIAQDEPLPDSVARAYLAYENAMTAQDYAAASEAAETAWQAARSERIDSELVGILAENYGNLALNLGAPAQAYPAWRNAAEISDRLRAPESERAERWYRASLSAFATGELRDARQCSVRASRAAATSQPPIDPGLSGDIHYMVASTSGQLGRLNAMAEHAPLAVTAFKEAGRPYDLVYANAYYLSGVGRFFEDDRIGSILDFHMARAIYAMTDAADQESNVRTTSFWVDLARADGGEAELAAVDAQIAASDFPGTGFTDIWDHEAADAAMYDVDAVPNQRRAPDYPVAAAQHDLDGIVLLRYAVTAEGRTDAAEVIAAAPGGIFEEAALRAVERWRYEPAMIDGQVVRREGKLIEFQFTMCDLPSVRACRLQQAAETD